MVMRRNSMIVNDRKWCIKNYRRFICQIFFHKTRILIDIHLKGPVNLIEVQDHKFTSPFMQFTFKLFWTDYFQSCYIPYFRTASFR